MPRFVPSVLIADCWGSVGDLTFYHVDGRCYYKKKSQCEFKGTPGQLEQLEVHRRALAAWRTVPHETQKVWHEYGKGALSHKPPFDGTSHISGQNLFVSAYHGFYTLGNEHTPEPQPFAKFPIDALEFVSCERPNSTDLLLRFQLTFEDCPSPERYHLLLKLQLTSPGKGKKPGLMRNFLALAPCSAGDSTAEILVKNYRDIWGLDLPEYQAHCHYVLLDRQTGYRNIHTPLKFSFSV